MTTMPEKVRNGSASRNYRNKRRFLSNAANNSSSGAGNWFKLTFPRVAGGGQRIKSVIATLTRSTGCRMISRA